MDSISLPTQESNEIGRKEFTDVRGLLGFGIGMISADFQDSGIIWNCKLRLKIFKNRAL
jgi:hypothetical protein